MDVIDLPAPAAISCAACTPDGRTLLLGDAASGDIVVWALGGVSGQRARTRSPRLLWRAALQAHTAAVTCLAMSAGHALVVSGGADGALLMWDLHRMACVRRLLPARLPAPPTALDMRDADGTLLVGAGAHIFACDVNGTELASAFASAVGGRTAATAAGGTLGSPDAAGRHRTAADAVGDAVTSCAIGGGMLWEDAQIVATGHASGFVRVWRLAPRSVQERIASAEADGADCDAGVPLGDSSPRATGSSGGPASGARQVLLGAASPSHALTLLSARRVHNAPVTAVHLSRCACCSRAHAAVLCITGCARLPTLGRAVTAGSCSRAMQTARCTAGSLRLVNNSSPGSSR